MVRSHNTHSPRQQAQQACQPPDSIKVRHRLAKNVVCDFSRRLAALENEYRADMPAWDRLTLVMHFLGYCASIPQTCRQAPHLFLRRVREVSQSWALIVPQLRHHAQAATSIMDTFDGLKAAYTHSLLNAGADTARLARALANFCEQHALCEDLCNAQRMQLHSQLAILGMARAVMDSADDDAEVL